jgi:hypothetical protein
MSLDDERSVNEANIKINDRFNGDTPIPHGKGEDRHPTEEANLKLQEAFYGDLNEEREIAPTYLSNNETAAIKVTGKIK